MSTVYKVVETSHVTEEELERLFNHWTREGWQLEGVQFAMRDSSKRPSMAFITWTRDMPESLGPGPIGLKNLVATTAWRRFPLSALPSMTSDWPLP